ncbi:MAG: MoaD/ThiS family protein [Bacteroidetes bacterium]|nr:MoaD/ThiS family protein [Bacteroidota bacterium]
MAKIIIPTPLRKFTDNSGVFETTGTTVQEAIQQLTQTHTNLERHLLDDHKNLRSFIRVYLGEDDINSLQKGATSVAKDAVISIVPAIAGGSH